MHSIKGISIVEAINSDVDGRGEVEEIVATTVPPERRAVDG